jgi:hypothetical protein
MSAAGALHPLTRSSLGGSAKSHRSRETGKSASRNYFVTTGHFTCLTGHGVLRYLPGIASSCPRAPGGLAAWAMRTTGRRWRDACQAQRAQGRQSRTEGGRLNCRRHSGSGYRPSLVLPTHRPSGSGKRSASKRPAASRQDRRIGRAAAGHGDPPARETRGLPAARNSPGCGARCCPIHRTISRDTCRTRTRSSIRRRCPA